MIQDFIINELENQKAYVERISDDRKHEWDDLNYIFLKMLS